MKQKVEYALESVLASDHAGGILTELEVFHFNGERENFEAFGQSNGGRYWFARDLMQMLGYESFAAFKGVVNRAIATCATLGIPIENNFIPIQREIDSQFFDDYKLSRFACYLAAMNGDVKKPQVAAAQAYFASVAEAVRQYIQSAENVERVLIREELSDREKSLSGVAREAGVVNYAWFQNAGYRGLYNMDYNLLKRLKGVPEERSLLDFMGKEELAANLFRITQTEAKLRNGRISGQFPAAIVAERVGRKVRQTMREISGTAPEGLAIAEDMRVVKSSLTKTHREFGKLDKRQQKRLPNQPKKSPA